MLLSTEQCIIIRGLKWVMLYIRVSSVVWSSLSVCAVGEVHQLKTGMRLAVEKIRMTARSKTAQNTVS